MGTGKSCHWSMELPKLYGGKVISIILFQFFLRKVAVLLEDLIVIGSWFQIDGEKANLSIFIFVLDTKNIAWKWMI